MGDGRVNVGSFSGLFVAEGSSDAPLAGIVQALFFERDIRLRISSPDFTMFGDRVAKDVKSRISAGRLLVGAPVDVIVVHRDSDNVEAADRRREIEQAVSSLELQSLVVPVIPVRMTEAWLLLDEMAIRHVAGNPRGRAELGLPRGAEVERRADPKKVLQECLLKAADVTGRRREAMIKRFGHHRRQLLELLDRGGPVTALESWKELTARVDGVAESLTHR
jgi:hypothetical protein